MICALEIGLLIWGIIAIGTGKLVLSKTAAVHGMAARLIGFIGLLPFPLAFAAGIVIGLTNGIQGQPFEGPMKTMLIFVEVGITLGCLVLMLSLGYAFSSKVEPAADRRSRYRDEFDDDEDARSRRKRRREEDADVEGTRQPDEQVATAVTANPDIGRASAGANSRTADGDDDDEAEHSVRKPEAQSASAMPWLILAGVGVFSLSCLCVVGGVGAYLAMDFGAAHDELAIQPAVRPPQRVQVRNDDRPPNIDKDKVEQPPDFDKDKFLPDPGLEIPKDKPFNEAQPGYEPYGRDYVKLPDNTFQWDKRGNPPRIGREQILPRDNEQQGLLGPKSDLWQKLGAQVKENKVLKTSIHGGGYGRDPFLELPADGSLLVGFYCDAGNWMGYVQPIFLNAAGEKPGKAYGQPQNQVMVVKAKEGYAIGRLYVRAGDIFDGFGVTFMKVKADGLDVNDRYDSDFIGSTGGAGRHIGGDGSFMVGIHGRLITDGSFAPVGNVATLGAVCVKMP